MVNSRLPAKALATLTSGTRSQERQRKRWIDNVSEDLHQRGSNLPQILKCVKDRKRQRKFVHALQPHRRQPTVEDGRVKEEEKST